jgi:hypothetical protein
MSYKLNRVGTPALGGALTRNSNHTIVAGDADTAWSSSGFNVMNINASAILARGNFVHRQTAPVTLGGEQMIGVVAPMQFTEDYTEDVFEYSIGFAGEVDSTVGLCAVAGVGPIVGADVFTTIGGATLLPSFTSQGDSSADHFTLQASGAVSLTRSTLTHVAYLGIALFGTSGSNNTIEYSITTIGLRKWAPNETGYPDYPDPKVQ